MAIEMITSAEANAALCDGHYLGSIEYPATVILAERDPAGVVHAVAVYAPPVAQHFKVVLPGCLELTRLWQSEARRTARSVYGPLSKFVRATLAWLREHRPVTPCVFSYTDPGIRNPSGTPHHGAVYQAARFKCWGESRVTDYWDDASGNRLSAPVCYRRYHTKSRTILSGTAPYVCTHKRCPTHAHAAGPGLTLVEKPPKLLFVFGLAKTTAEVREIVGGRYAEKETAEAVETSAVDSLPA